MGATKHSKFSIKFLPNTVTKKLPATEPKLGIRVVTENGEIHSKSKIAIGFPPFPTMCNPNSPVNKPCNGSRHLAKVEVTTVTSEVESSKMQTNGMLSASIFLPMSDTTVPCPENPKVGLI